MSPVESIPAPLMPLPQLRARRLLEGIRAAGYDVRVTVAGPERRLIVTGPTSRLTDAQRARLAAANDALIADVDTQASVERELLALIHALDRVPPQDRFPHYRQVLRRLNEAKSAGLLTTDRYRYVWAQLDGYTRSFPWPEPPAPSAGSTCNYNVYPDDEAIVEHVKRHGRIEARSAALQAIGKPGIGTDVPEPSKRRKGRSRGADAVPQAFGFAASAQLTPDCPLATDDAGERIVVVGNGKDVPRVTTKDAATADGAVLVYYTTAELAALRGVPAEQLRSIHSVKRTFDGEVVK